MKGETYHQHFRKCGKPNCAVCQEGPGHGPYWYAYRMVDGKTVQRYVGKTLPLDALPIGRHHTQILVGRNQEMERLRSILFAVKHTKRASIKGKRPVHQASLSRLTALPQVIVLTGEIGIGKTRVLEEIGHEAQAQRWNVVWERTVIQERHFPYQLWLSVLQKVLLTPSVMHEIEQHPQVYRPLRTLVPYLRELFVFEEVPVSPEQEQLRLWEAIRELLMHVAEGTPLLIVLDDVQWADESSCELLAYLARRIYGHPIIILATCRDKELPTPHALHSLLTDLQHEHIVETLSLEPLSSEQIATLVTQTTQPGVSLPEVLVEMIQDRSAGNPFFAEELARSVQMQHDATPLPTSITAVLDLRLRRLSKECYRLLSKAAVLGNSFELPLIQAMEASNVLEANESLLLDLLEEGLASGLLTEEGVGTRVTYLFWHPLLVSHLYEGLSATRRAILHRRAADILRSTYQDREEEGAALITHHLILGGCDSQRIIHYAELAGNRAYTLSAYPEAEKHYLIAVEHMEGREKISLHERLRLASLLNRVAECLHVQGKVEEARHQYERLLTVRVPEEDERVDAQLLALLCAEIGWTWRYSAEIEKALHWCEQAEQILRKAGIVGGPAWATLHYQQGSLCWQEGNYEEAIQHAQTSLTLFEEFLADHAQSERHAQQTRIQRTFAGDPVDVGRVHMLLAALFATIGQSKEAEDHLHIALSIFERYDCQREIATVCCNLGDMYLRQAKYEAAQGVLERAITITERIGDRPNMTVALANRGILALRQSDFTAAEELLTRALTLAEQIDDPIYQSLLHAYLSVVQQERGRPQDAKISLYHALKIGRAIHSAPCVAFAFMSLAQFHFSQATSGGTGWLMRRAKHLVDHALMMEGIEAETRVEGLVLLSHLLFSLDEKQNALHVAQQSVQQATQYGLMWLVPRAQAVLKRVEETFSNEGN